MRQIDNGEPSKNEPLWAYAYELLPPRATDRMVRIFELVHQETADATRNGRKWTARVVTEPQVTHVLVLSDTPDLDRSMNRRLEATLRELDIPYSVTLPMRVDDEAVPDSETP